MYLRLDVRKSVSKITGLIGLEEREIELEFPIHPRGRIHPMNQPESQ